MSDQLLAVAVSNWKPRFTANGVDASDYDAITSDLESWDEWCRAWSLAADAKEQLAHEALERGWNITAGDLFAMASTYHHFGKFLFMHDRELAKETHDKAVTALQLAAPLLAHRTTLHQVPFESASLAGILRLPHGTGPHPVVILVAGLDSTKEEFRAVERAFLDRGLATFAFDGPGQGEAEWTMAARPDWEVVGDAVCRYLGELDSVDPRKIGLWGVSLGGYYALRLASASLPIRATVALSGPYSFGAAWENLNPLTREAFVVRSFSPNAEVAATKAREFSMEGRIEKIDRPLLLVVGKKDKLFDWRDAERIKSETGPATEIRVLENGNHGCANVVSQHRGQSADWLLHQLTA